MVPLIGVVGGFVGPPAPTGGGVVGGPDGFKTFAGTLAVWHVVTGAA